MNTLRCLNSTYRMSTSNFCYKKFTTKSRKPLQENLKAYMHTEAFSGWKWGHIMLDFHSVQLCFRGLMLTKSMKHDIVCFCGIILAGILEWVAISSSRGSSWSGDRTCISHSFYVGKQIFHLWATREAPKIVLVIQSCLTLWDPMEL